MTRKDYELLVNALGSCADSIAVWPEPYSPHDTLSQLVDRLADDLADTNPNFDSIRFAEAAKAAIASCKDAPFNA